MTIDDLGKKIDRLDQNIDALAIITKKGFDQVDKRFDILEKRLNILEAQHEEIKLRLDSVAHRFELIALSKRVEFLEKKLGVSHR